MPDNTSFRRVPNVARMILLGGLALFGLWAVTVVIVYAQSGNEKLSWGEDYATWNLASGFVISRSHDGAYVRVFGNTREAMNVYRYNGIRMRYRDGEGTQKFPVGSVLAMESYERTGTETLGKKGPVFFMRKEAPGFDDAGGDWRYGMTDTQGNALADGNAGHATECRKCHMLARERDFVFAKDR